MINKKNKGNLNKTAKIKIKGIEGLLLVIFILNYLMDKIVYLFKIRIKLKRLLKLMNLDVNI